MSDDRKMTDEEVSAMFKPLVENLIAKHGEKEGRRRFRIAVEAAGVPGFRLVFPEDIS